MSQASHRGEDRPALVLKLACFVLLVQSLAAQNLREPPTIAWRFTPRGKIEAAPLAVDGRVIITTFQGPGRRGLHILDEATGRVLTARTFVSQSPLAPACAGRRLVIQPEPNRFDVLRFDGARISLSRSLRGSGPFSPPGLDGNELIAREGDSLFLQSLERRTPTWQSSEGRFRGTPERSGPWIYAVSYNARGGAELLALDAATGRVQDRIDVGHHAGRVPDVSADLSIVALPGALFVRHALAVIGSDKREYNTVRVALAEPGRFVPNGISLHALHGPPVQAGDGWVGHLSDGRGGTTWIAAKPAHGDPGQWSGIVLASRDRHASLLDTPPDSLSHGGVFFLADHAVLAEDFSVLWRAPFSPSRRLTVAGDGLLLVHADREVLYLRAGVGDSSPEREHALSVEARAEAELAKPFASLAERALLTNDADLILRLADSARQRSVPERSLQRVDAGLERLARTSRPPTIDTRRVAAIEAEEAKLQAGPVTALARAAKAERNLARRRALLRRALELDPAHAESHRQVRAMAADSDPGKGPFGSPFDAESWLDFLDVSSERSVRLVDPQTNHAAGLPWSELATWSQPARGFRTERFLVATTPGRPGAVARALEMGEALADVLDNLFPTTVRQRRDTEPMALFLYATREDYIRQSRAATSLPEAALGWSAGHYSASQNVSRMFVPSADEDLAQFLGVYAHELAHHWLATRAPFTIQHTGSGERPGFWIVEGFANLIEELSIDPRKSDADWERPDPRAHSLDVVANTPGEGLLPWRRLLTASHIEFADFSSKAELEIPLTWQLGAFAQVGEVQLFYAQAGAVCHYLFNGDGGRHRAKLLEYVAAWYRGDDGKLGVEACFGMKPDELGRRAVAFAREAGK